MSFHPSLLTPQAKAKKMMLWFAMISMTMMFAGLTSAYVVSKARPDWLCLLYTSDAADDWRCVVLVGRRFVK